MAVPLERLFFGMMNFIHFNFVFGQIIHHAGDVFIHLKKILTPRL